jgi:hypothetical protein
LKGLAQKLQLLDEPLASHEHLLIGLVLLARHFFLSESPITIRRLMRTAMEGCELDHRRNA